MTRARRLLTIFGPFFLAILFWLLIIATLLALGTRGFSHDENQYILGGYLAQTQRIYRDFLYLQPPLHAVLLSALFELFGSYGYFLVARLTTTGFAVGATIFFYLILRELGRSRFVAMIGCLFLVLTPTIYAAAAIARNDIMPLCVSLLAVWLVLNRGNWLGVWQRYLLAGFLVAAAVETKLNYVQMPIALAAFAALWPNSVSLKQRLERQFVPLLIGGAIGLGLVAPLAARDPTAFLYANFEHMLFPPAEYIAAQAAAFSQESSMRVATEQLTQTSLIGLAGLTVLFVSVSILRDGGKGVVRSLQATGGWVFWLIVGLALPGALLPAPSQPWYYVPIIPFLMLGLMSLWSREGPAKTWQALTIGFVALISLASGGRDLAGNHLLLSLDRSRWTSTEVLNRSRNMDSLLDQLGVNGKIATLSPALLIESKHAFYPELASGPFFFRKANFMPIQKVLRLHGASPATLHMLLAEDKPAAIFGGYEGWYDNPFFEFAQKNGYRRIEADWLKGGILYVRPSD